MYICSNIPQALHACYVYTQNKLQLLHSVYSSCCRSVEKSHKQCIWAMILKDFSSSNEFLVVEWSISSFLLQYSLFQCLWIVCVTLSWQHIEIYNLCRFHLTMGQNGFLTTCRVVLPLFYYSLDRLGRWTVHFILWQLFEPGSCNSALVSRR